MFYASVENKVKLILAQVRVAMQYFINALGMNRLCKCLMQQVLFNLAKFGAVIDRFIRIVGWMYGLQGLEHEGGVCLKQCVWHEVGEERSG